MRKVEIETTFQWEKFKTLNKPQFDRYLCAPLLPFVSLFYNQIKLTKTEITTLMALVKSTFSAHN